VTDHLGRLLLVTLEAARVDADLAVGALRSWLDSWRGIGDVVHGMARQGFDLQLTRYDARGWRATFYTTGMEHSITSAPTPCPSHSERRHEESASTVDYTTPQFRSLQPEHQ